MKREATISLCGSYRYDMTRITQPDCDCARCADMRARRLMSSYNRKPGFVLWVLCNPSTADGETDDATERRGWGFTSSWGYSKMVFVNVNPYRSTDPKKARVPGQMIIDHNEGYLMHHAIKASLIICAWGNNADKKLAQNAVMTLRSTTCEHIHTLGLTKNGTPKHPLYLPKDTKPQLWTI